MALDKPYWYRLFTDPILSDYIWEKAKGFGEKYIETDDLVQEAWLRIGKCKDYNSIDFYKNQADRAMGAAYHREKHWKKRQQQISERMGKLREMGKNPYNTKSAKPPHRDGGYRGSGYVYLMKHGDYHKIGKSKNPWRRRDDLQQNFPEEVELVTTIRTQDMTIEEQVLHDIFKDKRVRGEWFDLEEQDIRYILNYTPQNPH